MNCCAYGIAGRVTTAVATRHHCGAALRTRWTRGGQGRARHSCTHQFAARGRGPLLSRCCGERFDMIGRGRVGYEPQLPYLCSARETRRC